MSVSASAMARRRWVEAVFRVFGKLDHKLFEQVQGLVHVGHGVIGLSGSRKRPPAMPVGSRLGQPILRVVRLASDEIVEEIQGLLVVLHASGHLVSVPQERPEGKVRPGQLVSASRRGVLGLG
jgi:hypothetical protein